MSTVQSRLAAVNERIAAAAGRAGRDPSAVTLIAVSKTKPWELVAEAIACGQHDFGENTVQDALTKIPLAADRGDIVWHFIGHLQSNKARFVPGNFQWLHTLESIKLANRLERACGETGQSLNVLIQVNIADDPAKKGLSKATLEAFMEEILQADFRFLKLRGLMTIGAVNADEKTRRNWFSALRELQQSCSAKFSLPEFDQLSMGMSGDFEEAVEEGATLVRVGSTLFGQRNH